MNILMIMTDQQHKYALGAVTPYVKTPNLDKLAKNGTLFTNAYSNNPVCSPFRAILYSGKYSKDTGAMGNECIIPDSEITLPNELEKLGYETSFVGKYHIGDKGNTPILEKYRAGHKHFFGYQCYNGFLDNVCFYDENDVEHTFDGHRTDVTTEIGIDRLRMLAKKEKPFLHTIFYQAPHYPEQPSLKYEKMYDDFTFPMPEEFSEVEPYTPTFSPPSPKPRELDRDYKNYGGDIQRYLKLYYAMVSQIDENVGKILDELETLGIAEDTAIIFSADHGDMQGSHGMVNKCLPFERSCGIPLIVNIPGTSQIPVVDTPVSAVDYYPTCLDIAGVKSCKEIPGESLIPLSIGEKTSHIPVFAENNLGQNNWIMYRDEKFKIVAERDSHEPVYLFDMVNDNTESCNLLGKPEYAEIQADLTKKLIEMFNFKY